LDNQFPKEPDSDMMLSSLQYKIENLKKRIDELNQIILDQNSNNQISDSLRQLLNNSTTELALLESDLRFKSQFKAIPVPVYIWKSVGDDFKLVDYNDAADKITQGMIKDYIGYKVSQMYGDIPEVINDFNTVYKEKISKNVGMWYKFRTTGDNRYLVLKYAFLPPDSIIVHTEDTTLAELARVRDVARFKLLEHLKKTDDIYKCLNLCCQAVDESRLYQKSAICLFGNDSNLSHFGSNGYDSQSLELLKKSRQVSEFPASPKKDRNKLVSPIRDNKSNITGLLFTEEPYDSIKTANNTADILQELVASTIFRINEIKNFQEIKSEREALAKQNIALKEVINSTDEEKRKIKKEFYDIIENDILPLANKINPENNAGKTLVHQSLLSFLRDLKSDLSPRKFSFSKLTLREVEICHLIKDGLSSKKIGEILSLSPETVRTHRAAIRNKLDLKNSKINLRVYLSDILE